MNGDQHNFRQIKFKKLGSIAFGNNDKLKIIETSNIELKSNLYIQKVLLAEKLDINLLKTFYTS